MLGQLLAVARNAAAESTRQSIYVVVLLLGCLGIALTAYLATYTFDDENKLTVGMSMSTVLLGGILLAAFAAGGVIGREIEEKTVLTVVSKPLPRPIFVLGKFLGVAASVTLALYVWSLVFLLITRETDRTNSRAWGDTPALLALLIAAVATLSGAGIANYSFKKHFGASVAKTAAVLLTVLALVAMCFTPRGWELQAPWESIDTTILFALLGVVQAVWLVCAIAVAASTRLGQVATIIVCLGATYVGLISDWLFGGTSGAGQWAHRLWPNFSYLWFADAISQGSVVPFEHLVLTGTYTLLLIVAALALAVALFQTRQAA